MGFGGSFGLSGSKSKSQDTVERAQQPFLDFLRNNAKAMASTQDMSGLFELSQGLQNTGQGFLDTLGGNQFTDQLAGMATYDPTRVSANIDQLGADLGRQFNQQIMPGITSEAIGLGGMGGSRQGVAEGIAAQGVADALARGSTDIINQERARNLQAATTGGGMMLQGAMAGMQGLENMYNIGQAPFSSQWMPF